MLFKELGAVDFKKSSPFCGNRALLCITLLGVEVVGETELLFIAVEDLG